MYKSLDFNK
jgi:hypothetical protein